MRASIEPLVISLQSINHRHGFIFPAVPVFKPDNPLRRDGSFLLTQKLLLRIDPHNFTGG